MSAPHCRRCEALAEAQAMGRAARLCTDELRASAYEQASAAAEWQASQLPTCPRCTRDADAIRALEVEP